MQAIEFDATIQERSIPLPSSAVLSAGQAVRVVVMYEPIRAADTPETREGAIARLARNPLIVKGFTPLARDEAHER